jgi:carbonic anhydrase
VAGNARFVSGRMVQRDWKQAREQTATGQYPFAFVLSCVDSRTSSELIFDQGMGDIFNARVAGNVIDDDILGSMEFACKVAGARLIAVVGHTQCGAVKGACTDAKLGHLTGLLAKIRPAVDATREKMPQAAPTDGAFVETVADTHVQLVVQQIRARSAVLREMLDAGQIGVAAGIHDLATGRVTFKPASP